MLFCRLFLWHSVAHTPSSASAQGSFNSKLQNSESLFQRTHQIKNIISCCSFCRLYFFICFLLRRPHKPAKSLNDDFSVGWWKQYMMHARKHAHAPRERVWREVWRMPNIHINTIYTQMEYHQWSNISRCAHCLHIWIFIFVTRTIHSKLLGRKWMLLSSFFQSFFLFHSLTLAFPLASISHLFFTTFCPIRMAKNHFTSSAKQSSNRRASKRSQSI